MNSNGEIDILYALQQWFTFVKTSPLIFSDAKFWFLFAIVIAVVQFTKNKLTVRNMFLLGFSFFFYYKSSGVYFVLLIVSTIVDYYLGGAVYREENQRKKKLYVTLSLFSNLGLLAYYKYAGFIVDMVNSSFGTMWVEKDYFALASNEIFSSNLSVDSIFLPVGISFYTFQTISYTLDIYKGDIKPVKNIFDFAFFVSFFPQLVAGPIVRAKDFIPQIYEEYSLNKSQYNRALYLIVTGLIKKVLISDYISVNLVDGVFGNPAVYTAAEVIMAVYGYTLQIYCDFSGYSDMAIGISLLLGFSLNLNFDSPYKSLSITEFWRRWHISLSSWLKDYLYISLGGNRGASLTTQIFLPILYLILILVDDFSWLSLGSTVLIFGFWQFASRQEHTKLFYLAGEVFVLAFAVFLLVDNSWYELLFSGEWALLFAHARFYLFVLNVLTFILGTQLILKPENSTLLSTYLNLFITMFLGGLWHGASVKFIIWGALHGLALAIHKLWLSWVGKGGLQNSIWNVFSFLITFHFVIFCWIYFRAANIEDVQLILKTMVAPMKEGVLFDVIYEYRPVLFIMVFGYTVHWLSNSVKLEAMNLFGRLPEVVKALAITVVIVLLYQVKTSEVQPFIYFQF